MTKTLGAVTVLSYWASGTPVSETRRSLHESGVLKGTVSKVCTVLTALNKGELKPADVTSLNHAYALVKKPMSCAGIQAAIQRLNPSEDEIRQIMQVLGNLLAAHQDHR